MTGADEDRAARTEGPSWRRRGDRVKAGVGGAARQPESGWKRHLEGWQLAVVSVGIALVGALVAVPRAAAPDVLPRPVVDHPEVERELRVEGERALQAEEEILPYDVRAAGELMRRYGDAAAADEPVRAERGLGDLRVQAAVARRRAGDKLLLRLRAVQSRLFQRALLRWEATGAADDDLRQLGGDFLRKARASGWIAPPHRLLMSRAERSVLYRIRWSGLSGLLETYPFTPTLDDWRVYYGFLLQHPEGRDEHERTRNQLSYVTTLEEHDPSYLSALARGVLFYRLGHYSAAAQALRAHLDKHPDGAWTLRARNYLAAALRGEADRAGDEDDAQGPRRVAPAWAKSL
jgi:hypothetical protein